MGNQIPWVHSWQDSCKGNTCWYRPAVHHFFSAIKGKIKYKYHFSIAAVPLLLGLQSFPEGCGFKQWTGDDSKALMKVCFWQWHLARLALTNVGVSPGHCGSCHTSNGLGHCSVLEILLSCSTITAQRRYAESNWCGYYSLLSGAQGLQGNGCAWPLLIATSTLYHPLLLSHPTIWSPKWPLFI